jgi:hypothetical protein
MRNNKFWFEHNKTHSRKYAYNELNLEKLVRFNAFGFFPAFSLVLSEVLSAQIDTQEIEVIKY